MRMKKIFGNSFGKELGDQLELLLADRMTYYNQQRAIQEPEKKEEEDRKYQTWEMLMQEKYPELVEENQKFLDWLVFCHGEETEEAYLMGMRDGIRLTRWMMKL